MSLPVTYIKVTTSWKKVLKSARSAVEEGPRQPVILHCNQGFHRSPLILALLLAIFGGDTDVNDATPEHSDGEGKEALSFCFLTSSVVKRS